MPELAPVLCVVYEYERLDRAARAAYDVIWLSDASHKAKCNAQRRFDRRRKQINALVASATPAQSAALMQLTDYAEML